MNICETIELFKNTYSTKRKPETRIFGEGKQQRYGEIASLFSVANLLRVLALLTTKGDVRGVVESEKHVRNF